VVSLGIGIVFSLATVAVAIFFHSNELRQQRVNGDMATSADTTE